MMALREITPEIQTEFISLTTGPFNTWKCDILKNANIK